jgi:hypothetical protein
MVCSSIRLATSAITGSLSLLLSFTLYLPGLSCRSHAREKGLARTSMLDGNLVKMVVDLCKWWPEGGAGEQKQLVQTPAEGVGHGGSA